MRVLITGVTGFIGCRLAQRSREAGHDVVALGRLNNDVERERASRLQQAGLTVIEADLADTQQLVRLCDGCEVVFHLAAAQHEANVADEYFRRVNVDGTRNILDAAVQSGVGRFVHGSTIGVYGAAMDGQLDEASPLQPDNIYGATKLEAERVVLNRAGDIPVCVVRISETYGPGDRRLLKLFKAIDKKAFFIIGKGDNDHQLIYVDDLIDGLYRAATEQGAVGEIFVLAGLEVITTSEMATTIAASLDVQLMKMRAPMWPFLAAAWLMEQSLPRLGIQPPLHRRRLDFFRKSFSFLTAKAERELHFIPKTAFADGVAATAAWYRRHGDISANR